MESCAITSVRGWWVLDSRGCPTVRCEIAAGGSTAVATAPSGASVGTFEAVELRDGGKAFGGKGVSKAVRHVNGKIAAALKGKDAFNQTAIDEALITADGTATKARLGANATIAASMACFKLGAALRGKEVYSRLGGNRLPVPFCNVINGGKHASNGLPFQEYMLVPVRFNSFPAAVQAVSETYHALKERIKEKCGGAFTSVGDEGGFTPPCRRVEEPLELMDAAIAAAGYSGSVKMAVDVAASSFINKGKYVVYGRQLTAHALANVYEKMIDAFDVISIEDAFAEEDWLGFAQLTREVGGKVQVVGDDLLVTNPERIRKAANLRACNTALIKPNQIGTVTETLEAMAAARQGGMRCMVSHRSGETEDYFISDLACGTNCGQIKLGAPCRGERTAKYNRLLEINAALGKRGYYAGKVFGRGVV
ncbi:MAG: phosphopyruvate hydratase [Candidatus Micrarchaeota archaeon]